ncbi:hypothetical protein BM221_009816 [Beauveria bassiana]|uniref:Uncharacterized protein n=1 Tax=Beauveria bassiana TaxID=176275 RepID=A0A2N6NAY1_BEABA|nr:hypothetical protein BM221_009816 [Beauveria bassiana]
MRSRCAGLSSGRPTDRSALRAQVKCNGTQNGCSRCESLGKKCRFSEKPTNRKPCRGDFNRTQRQPSIQSVPDPTFSSWSTITNTENDKGTSSDGWSHYFESHPDGKTDHGVKRQLESQEHQRNPSTNVQTTLDPSHLSILDQTSTGSNPSSSPFEVGRNTQSEPSRPATARSSENTSPQSLSLSTGFPVSRSDLQFSFQPQSSELLKTGPNDAGTESETLILASLAFSAESSATTGCYCLAATVFAVEELENSYMSGKRAELDSIVACQKQAIACCRSLMRCGACIARRDTVVLLVLMTEKVVMACERISFLFQARKNIGSSVPGLRSPLDHASPYDKGKGLGLLTPPASGLFSMNAAQPRLSGTPEPIDTPKGWQEIFLGDYEITCPQEWQTLIRAIILLQLTSLTEMLVDLKSVGSTLLGETQMLSLTRAIMKLGEIEAAIYTL